MQVKTCTNLRIETFWLHLVLRQLSGSSRTWILIILKMFINMKKCLILIVNSWISHSTKTHNSSLSLSPFCLEFKKEGRLAWRRTSLLLSLLSLKSFFSRLFVYVRYVSHLSLFGTSSKVASFANLGFWWTWRRRLERAQLRLVFW